MLCKSLQISKIKSRDVRNAKELKLIVNDAGDGDSSDHASFGDAKLATLSSKPIIKGENLAYNMDEKVDLMKGITATDIEDGNITSKVQIKSSDFVEGKSGIFKVVYSVTDSDGLTSECSRTIAVTDKETQLSDLNWKSATIGSGSVRKDRAVSGNQIRLLNEDNGDKEICRYNLSEDGGDNTALLFAELERNNGSWQFKAKGELLHATVSSLANMYK